jgi:hypothetical protein
MYGNNWHSFTIQIVSVQQRLGRDSTNYNYGRACVIRICISVNGRYWKRKTVFDYVEHSSPNGPTSIQVGAIRDFVVVTYTHKDILNLQGRCAPATLKGEIIYVRARKYNPTPIRESNLWISARLPAYHRRDKAIHVLDLGSYLHIAPERSGRPNHVNLVTVANAF